jgi:hypothetical protein
MRRGKHQFAVVGALAMLGLSIAGPTSAVAQPGTPAGPALVAAPTAVADAARAARGAYCQTPVDLTRRAPGQSTVTRFGVDSHENAVPAYDRVVIRLSQPAASFQVRYVKQVIQDASGLPVPLRGDADIEVRVFDAVAHDDSGASTVPVRSYLRDWSALRQATIVSDFEGVLQVGIGVSTRVDFRAYTLANPDRLVVDLALPRQHPWTCTTGLARVYFFNEPNYIDNVEPFYTPVWRRVTPGAAMGGAVSSLFHGPLVREHNAGLRFLSSEATGFAHLRVSNGIARLQLTGGCNAGGSTESIAGEISPTLKQFPGVQYVKIYDPWGQTGDPTGPRDSSPDCLNP